MKYLTKPQVDAALKHLDQPYRLCALFQWRAGLRVTEAINVRPADIDLEAGTITVQPEYAKGGRQRTIPLHPEIRTALQFVEWPKKGPFVDRHRASVFRAYEAAGISGTHTLRHSAARQWLLTPDIEINTVKVWLGHANLQTTLVYLDLDAASPGLMAKVE